MSWPDFGYVPEEYIDEVSPAPRATPDAWLIRLDDGAPALAPGEEGDAPRRLRDGQMVSCLIYRDHGRGRLTVHADGSYAAEPPMPAGATHVMIAGDRDTLADSVAELMSRDAGTIDRPETGEHELHYYEWSDGEVWRYDAASHRFVRDGRQR